MKLTLTLIAALFCLSVVYAQGTENNPSLKKVTENDLTGVWTFERAEYWELTAKSPVLREKITSPNEFGKLVTLCLGNGISDVVFLPEGTTVSTLLTLMQHVELRLMDMGEELWLELQWRNDFMTEDTPALSANYKIQWAEEGLLELTHDALCHDHTGAMYHNMLKMFLRPTH